MVNNLDILFVNPNAKKENYGSLASELSGIEPPIWCGLKAAYVREHGYSVKILDAEAENLSPEQTAEQVVKKNPLLVEIVVMGINPSASSTPKMGAVREIIAELRKISPDGNIMLSGLHPSALPEKTLKEEDVPFVCVGEGLNTTLHLIKTIKSNDNDFKINGLWYKKNNKIVKNPPAEVIQNLDDLPFVAWDMLPMDKYRAHNWQCFHNLKQRKPYTVIYTSLGCPFNCTYCNIHTMYSCKPGIRFRSPKKVVDELEFLVKNYGIKNVKILDELFVLNENRVIEICDLIINRDLDLNIWAYARVDTVNERILNKLKQAGINWLCFGIEAGSKKVRDDVDKGKFGQEAIKNTMKMTREAGIHIIGNFMFGLPEDDFETMQDTLDLAKEINCEYVNFYTVMAYPGSKLYEDAIKERLELPKNWLGFGQLCKETTPLPSKHLSNKEILRFRDNAFEEYYKNPEYREMIQETFGMGAIKHIEKMLSHKMERNLLST